jgi:hypothetical protein
VVMVVVEISCRSGDLYNECHVVVTRMGDVLHAFVPVKPFKSREHNYLLRDMATRGTFISYT